MDTPSKRLAEEYLRLGGKRRAKVDDNVVTTREWEEDTASAEAFWRDNIAPLDDKKRAEVELFLPTINSP